MELFEKSRIRLTFDTSGEFRLLCVSDYHAPAEKDWDERLIRAEEALLDEVHPHLFAILGDLTHDGGIVKVPQVRMRADRKPELLEFRSPASVEEDRFLG